MLAGCSAPPPPTAPESARADEIVKGHEREQLADLEAASNAASLLNIPATLEVLDRIKGRLREFTAAIAKLIVSIEKKSANLAADNARLRDASYASFRAMVWWGGIILALGLAAFCWVWTRQFAGLPTAFGGSLLVVGLAMQTIGPWVPWIVGACIAICAGILILEVWQNRRAIISIVKPADLLKLDAPESAVERVYAAKDSIASEMQSPGTRKLVAAARKAAPVRERRSTGQEPTNASA